MRRVWVRFGLCMLRSVTPESLNQEVSVIAKSSQSAQRKALPGTEINLRGDLGNLPCMEANARQDSL